MNSVLMRSASDGPVNMLRHEGSKRVAHCDIPTSGAPDLALRLHVSPAELSHRASQWSKSLRLKALPALFVVDATARVLLDLGAQHVAAIPRQTARANTETRELSSGFEHSKRKRYTNRAQEQSA